MWFARIGYGLGGVQGLYFLGFLVQSLNAFLLYHLLKKWLDRWSAILGGCLFFLFSPDPTPIFLGDSPPLPTSLTYFLVGLLIKSARPLPLSSPLAPFS